jgi:hypothetical protein
MLFRRVPFLAAILVISGPVTAPLIRANEPMTLIIVEPQQPLPPLVGQADRPTTRPSRPATQPVSETALEALLKDLAAPDGAVRDRAFARMLHLTRVDLPALRRTAERSRPLAPSQAAALHDVVGHVFLSDEPYVGHPGAGFLGLLIPALDSVDVPRPDEPDQAADASRDVIEIDRRVLPLERAHTGVPIEYRIPGFCAFRALREGDVVLRIVTPVPRRLRDWPELSMAVRGFPAGATIQLEVVRQGVTMNVPVTLDARPIVSPESDWQEEVLPTREAAADGYWNEHFAPLVDDRATADAK